MLGPHELTILRNRIAAIKAHPERFTDEERAWVTHPKTVALAAEDHEEHRRLCAEEDARG